VSIGGYFFIEDVRSCSDDEVVDAMEAATLNHQQVGNTAGELRNLSPRHVGNLIPCRVTLGEARVAKLNEAIAVVLKCHIVD